MVRGLVVMLRLVQLLTPWRWLLFLYLGAERSFSQAAANSVFLAGNRRALYGKMFTLL